MSSSNGSYTYTPIGRSVKTILGSTNDLELTLGLTPLYDLNSTLNKKYNIIPSVTPPSHPIAQYFGIGIGGTYNVTSGGVNLTQPYDVSATDMDLYVPLPFRCVPAAQDLDPTTQAQYRMRVPIMINGQPYIAYYLKKLTLAATSAAYSLVNPTTGVETPYTLDYANLTPTPPANSVNGTVSGSSEEVNVSSAATLPLTGTEVLEVVSALYAGDLRYARITEIGIYTGTDVSSTTTTSAGTPLTYTEASCAQLDIHNTFNGIDMSSPSATLNQQFVFYNGSIVLI